MTESWIEEKVASKLIMMEALREVKLEAWLGLTKKEAPKVEEEHLGNRSLAT